MLLIGCLLKVCVRGQGWRWGSGGGGRDELGLQKKSSTIVLTSEN